MTALKALEFVRVRRKELESIIPKEVVSCIEEALRLKGVTDTVSTAPTESSTGEKDGTV